MYSNPYFPMCPDDMESVDLEQLDHLQNPIPPDVDKLLDIPAEEEAEAAYQRNLALDPDRNRQCWEDHLQRDEEWEAVYATEQHFWSHTQVPEAQESTFISQEQLIPETVAKKSPDRADPPAIKAEVVKESTSIAPYTVAQELLRSKTFLISGNTIYFYNGIVYQLLTKEDMLRLLVDCCRDAMAQVGEISFIKKIYDCLYLEPSICRHDLRPSQDHLVFLDGILDLRTGKFGSHTSEIFTTHYLLAHYHACNTMTCKTFERFVNRLAGGNPFLIRRIWEAIGYLLTPDQKGKKFVILQGPTNSGKSVLGRFIKNCFPKEAVSALGLHDFGGEFSMSDLIGRALCLDMDLPAGALNDRAISHLKKLTGDDAISANVKFMPRATFANTAKLLFASNHMILTSSVDKAFEARMLVIPVGESIPESEQDRDLSKKLDEERDAIVAQAITCYFALRENGYKFSGDFAVNDTAVDGEALMDRVWQFAELFCEAADHTWESTQHLYGAFCVENGEVCTKNVFSELFLIAVNALFPDVKKVRNRIGGKGNPLFGYSGIRLKSQEKC